MIDRRYQKDLRSQQAAISGVSVKDDTIIAKNMKVLEMKCEEINSFQVELAIKKSIKRENFNHNRKTYIIMRS